MTKRTLLMVIGGLVAIAVAVGLLLASQDDTGQLQQRMSARQTTTIKLIADGQKNISSSDLAKLNSELSIILAGDNTALQTALKKAGLKKIELTVKSAEADTATFEKLSTAKLNAQYDTTYQNVLRQKLDSLQALLKELHGKTRSKSLKEATATEYSHVMTYLTVLDSLPQD